MSIYWQGSLNQHIYYFHLQIGNVANNDALISRLFMNTLNRVTFNQFISLLVGLIKSLVGLETLLCHFLVNNTKMMISQVIVEKQRMQVPYATISRNSNISSRCLDSTPLLILLRTCQYNLLTEILSNMGTVKAHFWNKLRMLRDHLHDMNFLNCAVMRVHSLMI